MLIVSVGMPFSPNIYVLMACRFVQACSIMGFVAAEFVLCKYISLIYLKLVND
jgi:hypothetical protein